MKAIKVAPNERLLIEQGVNQYKIAGPGRVWLAPWQRVVTQFKVGSHSQPFKLDEVRTREQVPLNLTGRVSYEIDLIQLNTEQLLPKIPALQEQGWHNALQWQTEYVLRQLVADYDWPNLGRQAVQERLERQLVLTLSDRLRKIGLRVTGAYLVNIELPLKLQKTLLQAEQDCIEATGRARVLQQYFNIFGRQIPAAMPYILQWETMNMLRKNGQSHLLLAQANLPLYGCPLDDTPPATFQLQLPIR
jgi:hypothetical protein